MSDPIVHITAGIPDGGTGNITTLGQTLVDGANATVGAKADTAVTATDTTPGSMIALLKGIISTAATLPTATDFDAKIGVLTETAPATDIASSGLNGRLQRIAQRLTSLIALLPGALGTGGGLKVDGSGTALPVSGTVTANAGTNLNTSTLALEAGGNLATIAGAVSGSKVATKAASGDFADGAIATIGVKADAADIHTDTTAISAMSVWKQISKSIQVVAAWVAGGRAVVSASASVVLAKQTYQAVAASQTHTALQTSTGAIGDYLDGILIVPASTSPGAVAIEDGAGSDITIFAGGATSVSSLVPFFVPIGAVSAAGAWKVTTGASVSIVAIGNFS